MFDKIKQGEIMYIDLLLIALEFFFLFMSSLLLLGYLQNKNKKDPKITKHYGVTVLIPIWNEESTIKDTLISVEKMLDNYKGKSEILVIDNNSTDNSPKIIKEFIKKHPRVKLISEKNKQGKSFALNTGIKKAKYPIIITIDADSFPHKDALNYIIGYFDDPKIGAVATKLRVKNPKNLIEKFQNIEYFYSNFYVTALDFFDSIYVTRGPLSAFRKSVLEKIDGFIDPKITPTEDMEITYRIRKLGYKIKVSRKAIVDTKAMPSLKALYKQRMRWNTGTLKTLFLHKDLLFNPFYGIFALVFAPMVILNFILIFVLIYLLFRFFANNIIHFKSFIWDLAHGIYPNFNWITYAYNHIYFYIPYIFLILLISIVMLIFIYFYSFKESKSSFKTNAIPFLFYTYIYYLFLVIFGIISVFKVIFNTHVSWR